MTTNRKPLLVPHSVDYSAVLDLPANPTQEDVVEAIIADLTRRLRVDTVPGVVLLEKLTAPYTLAAALRRCTGAVKVTVHDGDETATAQ